MSLAKLFVEVGANVNNFERGMKQVRSEIDQTAKQATFFSNTLSTAIGTGTAIAVNKAVSSLTNFFSYIKKAGEEFNALKENSQLAFETMLGSGEKAKTFLMDLQKFAEATPFELPGLIDASQKMLAFDFTAKQVIPTLTSIGDAVAGLGGSPEKLQRVITAIGQIKAKGKIQAQEMLQLAEAGIPAWEMLAKAIGKTIPEAMKESEKGAIDATTAINALINGMNAKFGGLMAKQSKSFTGLKSTFNDLMRDVAARVTKPWFDNAKKGLERMIAIMQSDKFQGFITKATAVSEKAANLVANVKHNIIDFIGHGFNFFHSFFGSTSDAKQSFSLIESLPKKIKNLVNYIKPVGDFIYNIADKGFRAFTGIFDDFYRSFNKISNQRFYFFGDMSLEQFATGIKSIFNDIRSGGKNLNYWLYTAPKVFQVITRLMLNARNIFNYFSGEGLQTTLKKLGSILTGLGSILSKLVRPFKEALGSLFQQLSTMKNLGFADIFTMVLKSIGQAFMGFLKVIKDEFWPTIKGALIWVWDSLTSFVSSIDWTSVWGGVVGVFTGLHDFVTNINWKVIGDTVVSVFSSIVEYVQSIDWGKLWYGIWSVLSGIGNWFVANVMPPISDFFSWLLSWFSDTSKNNQMLAAIKTAWTFITDWGLSIWQTVSPYLSSFFGWLLSWFTDTTKRQQLWSAITTTWTFVTDWAKYIWDSISPYLGSFFSYLLSWFTDSTKRGQLWNGIVATWNFVIEWGKSLWNWIAPYLAQFWGWLTSWVTDPTKRTELWNGIVNGWDAITTWGANLWGWLYPNLITFWSNLKTWIDTNHPTLGSWINSFTQFSKDVKTQWNTDLPEVVKQFVYLKDTIITETPKIIKTLDDLSSRFGEGWNFTGGQLFAGLERDLADLVKMASKFLEIVDAMVATTQSAFNLDWQGYVNNSLLFGQRLGEFGQIWQENQAWWNNQQAMNNQSQTTFPGGHAKGGIASGWAVVGEKGPELAQFPTGTRIWDHGQSMGMLSDTSSNQTITIVLKNEGTMPTDRRAIDQIAMELQRRMNLQGNRLVFA